MKTLKIAVIATIITSIIMLSCAVGFSANAEEYGEFYPRLSIVIETHENTVICQDKEGNLWAFFSDENEWTIGDICNLLMWNNSEDITNHEVIEVYWEGHTENIDLFLLINKWA